MTPSTPLPSGEQLLGIVDRLAELEINELLDRLHPLSGITAKCRFYDWIGEHVGIRRRLLYQWRAGQRVPSTQSKRMVAALEVLLRVGNGTIDALADLRPPAPVLFQKLQPPGPHVP